MIERRLVEAVPVLGRTFLSWLAVSSFLVFSAWFPVVAVSFLSPLVVVEATFLVPTSTISSTAGIVIVLDFSTRPVSTPSV